jgi:hypothetical protein
MKTIGKFARFGAVGFGIGGAIFGTYDFNYYLVILFGLPVVGAIGGVALGLALGRGWRKIAALAGVGAIGFFLGNLVGFIITAMFTGLSFWEAQLEEILDSIIFHITLGTVVGTALGLALWNRRKVIGLGLAGALGGAIGAIIMSAASLSPWLQVGLHGIVGGASLGAALGYLEKRKGDREGE